MNIYGDSFKANRSTKIIWIVFYNTLFFLQFMINDTGKWIFYQKNEKNANKYCIFYNRNRITKKTIKVKNYYT